MALINSPEKRRLLIGVSIGIILLILTGCIHALAILMVSVLVFGCTHSPPDWVYMIVFFGFPIPLIIASIVVPYLYIKKQKLIRMIVTLVAGIYLSCLIFLVWFLLLTRYC